MDSSLAVSKALGRYRGPWFVVWPATAMAAGWIFLAVARLSRQVGWESVILLAFWMVFLAAVWLVPQTIVSIAGVRLVWRRRFVPWEEVERIYAAGPGDPNILVGLRAGRALSLPGVKHDRLPGILILARMRGPVREG